MYTHKENKSFNTCKYKERITVYKKLYTYFFLNVMNEIRDHQNNVALVINNLEQSTYWYS